MHTSRANPAENETLRKKLKFQRILSLFRSILNVETILLTVAYPRTNFNSSFHHLFEIRRQNLKAAKSPLSWTITYIAQHSTSEKKIQNGWTLLTS